MRGNGRATLAAVAQAAGVSKATASVVLNGRTDRIAIGEATQALVREAAAQLGYRPHHAARALSRSRTDSISLLVGRLADPYFIDIVGAVQTVVANRSYSLNIVETELASVEEQILDHLLSAGSDGVIIATIRHTSRLRDALQEIVRRQVPVVMILDQSPAPTIPAVRIDDGAAAELATRHLLDLGHRRIAFIVRHGWQEVESQGRAIRRGDVYRGYRRALAEAGVPCDPDWLVQDPDPSLAGGHRAMASLLARGRRGRPTAAVAYKDVMAVGALRALYEARVRVPEELALVGIGGIALGAYSTPALTTVEHPRDDLGRLAAETLFGLLDGHAPAEIERVLPVRLVVRESCGAAR